MSTLGLWIGVLLFVEACALAFWWGERAIPRTFVRWGRNEPRRTALLVLATHACVSVVVALVWLLERDLDPQGASRTRFGLVVTPGLAILAPLALVWMPSRFAGFRSRRRDLVRAGASEGTARAFYWAGAVSGIAAFMVVVVALLELFPASK